MSLAVVKTRALVGVQGEPVDVEVHLANGLPAFNIVGLPETAVKESKDRVRAAIINSAFEFPARRITVNLAPADLPKTGGRFDLPIAIGILIASGQLQADVSGYELVGELALTGELRAVTGVLPTALASKKDKHSLIVPRQNEAEAAIVLELESYYATSLLQVFSHLNGQSLLKPCVLSKVVKDKQGRIDLTDVKGQAQAKRALEVAASGNHNILFIGPPGTGKSMLAARLPDIMPELEQHAALEVAAISSIKHGEFKIEDWKIRPFRNPHHNASAVALVGGGSHPKPGEISLAHQGVLFLDELTEFPRMVLEQLREPLETGKVHIARAAQLVTFSADFLLVAACNPCKCSYFGDGTDRCNCSASSIESYRNKLSGPLLDRIDMHVHLPRVPTEQLRDKSQSGETSEVVRARVTKTRERQQQRQGCLNSELNVKPLDEVCELSDECIKLLEQASQRLHLSARAYHRILKLARTIADMKSSANIQKQHIAEAIGYRSLDRS